MNVEQEKQEIKRNTQEASTFRHGILFGVILGIVLIIIPLTLLASGILARPSLSQNSAVAMPINLGMSLLSLVFFGVASWLTTSQTGSISAIIGLGYIFFETLHLDLLGAIHALLIPSILRLGIDLPTGCATRCTSDEIGASPAFRVSPVLVLGPWPGSYQQANTMNETACRANGVPSDISLRIPWDIPTATVMNAVISLLQKYIQGK